MGSVMTRPTMLTATMMAVIAVSTSTPITALIALVIIRKTVWLGLFPLLLEMVCVMTRQTMLTVTMTAVIAASTSTRITALIAHVTIKKTVLLGLLPLLLEMVSVMTRQTMLTAITMVETAVDPALTLIIVFNVHVLVKLLAMEFQML
jgi:hypothetical protein